MKTSRERRQPTRRARKLLFLSIFALVFGGAAAPAASAQTIGLTTRPAFSDLGTQLRMAGTLTTDHDAEVDVVLSATGDALIACTNPGARGRPVSVTTTIATTGSETVTIFEGGYGTVFNVTTEAPDPPAGVCPNPKWTATVRDVVFNSATLTVIEPSGSDNVVYRSGFDRSYIYLYHYG